MGYPTILMPPQNIEKMGVTVGAWFRFVTGEAQPVGLARLSRGSVFRPLGLLGIPLLRMACAMAAFFRRFAAETGANRLLTRKGYEDPTAREKRAYFKGGGQECPPYTCMERAPLRRAWYRLACFVAGCGWRGFDILCRASSARRPHRRRGAWKRPASADDRTCLEWHLSRRRAEARGYPKYRFDDRAARLEPPVPSFGVKVHREGASLSQGAVQRSFVGGPSRAKGSASSGRQLLSQRSVGFENLCSLPVLNAGQGEENDQEDDGQDGDDEDAAFGAGGSSAEDGLANGVGQEQTVLDHESAVGYAVEEVLRPVPRGMEADGPPEGPGTPQAETENHASQPGGKQSDGRFARVAVVTEAQEDGEGDS